MTGKRAAELEELRIAWDTAGAGLETNLAAAPPYYELHGTLAAPRPTTTLDQAVGHRLTNVRRPRGLGQGPRTGGAAARGPRRDRPGLEPGALSGRWTGSGAGKGVPRWRSSFVSGQCGQL